MFSKSKNQASAGEFENNGHVFQFNPDTAPSGATDVPRINKGMLDLQGTAETYYSYDFLQAHFHWGSHSGQGSEHRIDDVEYRGAEKPETLPIPKLI